jgi:hypothetical protein
MGTRSSTLSREKFTRAKEEGRDAVTFLIREKLLKSRYPGKLTALPMQTTATALFWLCWSFKLLVGKLHLKLKTT